MRTATPQLASRLTGIDVIRAFALLGIAAVNYQSFATVGFGPPVRTAADDAAMAITTALFVGKSFPLFAFLFGYGFPRPDAGDTRVDDRRMALWRRRMGWLLGIGILHACLVYAYDILMVYAVFGLIFMHVGSWPSRRLVIHAVAGWVLAVAAYAFMGWLFGRWELEWADEVWEADRHPTFRDAVATRIDDVIFCQSINLLYNGPLTLSALCMGILARRRGWLDPARFDGRRASRVVMIALPCGILFALPLALWPIEMSPGTSALTWAALALGAPLAVAGYVAAVLLMARRLPGLAHGLANAGRASLSLYVIQGILAGWIFFDYGFGMIEMAGAAATLLFAVLVWLLMIPLATLWLRHFQHGPLETLWRRLTRGNPPTSGR